MHAGTQTKSGTASSELGLSAWQAFSPFALFCESEASLNCKRITSVNELMFPAVRIVHLDSQVEELAVFFKVQSQFLYFCYVVNSKCKYEKQNRAEVVRSPFNCCADSPGGIVKADEITPTKWVVMWHSRYLSIVIWFNLHETILNMEG